MLLTSKMHRHTKTKHNSNKCIYFMRHTAHKTKARETSWKKHFKLFEPTKHQVFKWYAHISQMKTIEKYIKVYQEFGFIVLFQCQLIFIPVLIIGTEAQLSVWSSFVPGSNICRALISTGTSIAWQSHIYPCRVPFTSSWTEVGTWISNYIDDFMWM